MVECLGWYKSRAKLSWVLFRPLMAIHCLPLCVSQGLCDYSINALESTDTTQILPSLRVSGSIWALWQRIPKLASIRLLNVHQCIWNVPWSSHSVLPQYLHGTAPTLNMGVGGDPICVPRPWPRVFGSRRRKLLFPLRWELCLFCIYRIEKNVFVFWSKRSLNNPKLGALLPQPLSSCG